MRLPTEATTASGNFIKTWSYFGEETVMFERRKHASTCLNHLVGSAVQKSGNLTPTTLTAAGGGLARASALAARSAAIATATICRWHLHPYCGLARSGGKCTTQHNTINGLDFHTFKQTS